MSRVILYVSVASIAFFVGLAANWSVNTLGSFAVDEFDSAAPVDVRFSTILPGERSFALPVHNCGPLVVSVTANGALNLNAMPKGFLKDTRALTASLRTIFERREELHVYVDRVELSSRVSEHRQIEKTVYIKARRSMSYGEVADLIAAVKEAGSNPVGLIADLPSPKP